MIKINDGRGQREQNVAGINVQSSGGVPPAWAGILPYLPLRGSILDYGSWQGLAALWLKAKGANVVYAHHLSSQSTLAKENAQASLIPMEVRDMFPIQGEWDCIVMEAPPQGDALLMMLSQGAASLTESGTLYLLDKRKGPELEEVFSKITELATIDGWKLISCKSPVKVKTELPLINFDTVVRDIDVQLTSLPGTFSPGSLDAGTRVMLEKAQIPKGGRVLDLACGNGVVGIVASKLGAQDVVYIDDNLVALTCCRQSLTDNQVPGEIVHGHRPQVVRGKFDCILVNPPYHSDYGVAKSFIEFAHKSLNPGGLLYIVVKKAQWYKNKLENTFGGCKLLEEDGYSLLWAEKRLVSKNKNKQTTKKHLRRQQVARGRR